MNDNRSESSLPQQYQGQGSDERAVTEIRAYLRIGDTGRAGRLFDNLFSKLLRQIQKRAEESLHRYGRDMPAEGIAAAITLLWTRISNFETHPGTLHMEIRFQQVFTLLLSDAFKSVRTERHGLSEAGMQFDQLDAEAPTSSDGTPTPDAGYGTGDPFWETAFHLFTNEQIARELLSLVPDKRWADALLMESEGYERAEIASHYGKSEKTIYNWTEKAKECLMEYLLAKYPLDRYGRPILE